MSLDWQRYSISAEGCTIFISHKSVIRVNHHHKCHPCHPPSQECHPCPLPSQECHPCHPPSQDSRHKYLAGVAVPEVGDDLDELSEEDHGNVGGLAVPQYDGGHDGGGQQGPNTAWGKGWGVSDQGCLISVSAILQFSFFLECFLQ